MKKQLTQFEELCFEYIKQNIKAHQFGDYMQSIIATMMRLEMRAFDYPFECKVRRTIKSLIEKGYIKNSLAPIQVK